MVTPKKKTKSSRLPFIVFLVIAGLVICVPLGDVVVLLGFLFFSDVPIKFYGKVVDQDETPLANATVSWRISKSGISGSPPPIMGTAVTNASGVFAVSGERGRGMDVQKIAKEGYRQAKSAYMGYGYRGVSNPHVPDAKHPVVFLLIKDELPEVEYRDMGGVPLAWNQGVTRIPLGWDNLELLVTATRVRNSSEMRGFAWNVEISVNDAELCEIQSGGPPLAPSDGYQQVLRYGFAANAKAWRGRLDKKLAFKTRSGLFGRVDFDLYSDRSQKAFYFESGLNPSGGRNLK